MEACIAKACTSTTSGAPAHIFAHLIQTLILAQCSIESQQTYPPDRTDEILKNDIEFDFIIAGGGSAGSVVASRLSENPNWRVLLIERGDDPSFLSDIPGFLLLLQNGLQDYNYKVVPDNSFCLGMKNHQCIWAKGKALGGSSVINAMLHIIGNDADYDNWSKMGNQGWSYKEVLPYFRKMENYHPDIVAKYGSEHFGTGGPLTLRPFNYSATPIQDILFSAVKDLKLPIMDMLNEEKFIGFGKAYGTIDNGIRQNVAKAYLGPVKDRKNLYVMKSARVDSVILSKKRAKGVSVTLKDGRKIELKALKEVVLSAGSLATPQILMLSGIGPKSHLKSYGIKVIADLPVGKNLQDHVLWLGIHMAFNNETTTPASSNLMFDWAYDYLIHRKSEFSTIGGVDFLGFVNTKNPLAKHPNIEYHFIQIPKNSRFKIDAITTSFNFDDDLSKEMRKANEESEIILACPVLINPRSSGYLKLKSSDPADQIEIHANYFHDLEDIDTMLEGLAVLRSFVDTKTFKKYKIKLRHMEIPGCSMHPVDSKDYWICNLRHTASTVYHPVGTCRMGPSNSNDSVVDPSLKVRKIQGLRIIDASIMPKITSGNTHAPTLMIAEKGAELIKMEWLMRDEL
ncbi:hypothetical protein QAD02_018729 [Eretmocerus hayati]|uniref:Uncharacterized protein n=1 Tax=Eretmocerus hayati TaxID=131215 RepID=A0ACC2PHK1_9HYME|nr:hypothetical protein QAD02_018729 [Eretmocerus hayati]